MIGRIWHGYTTLENTDTYEQLLKEEIFINMRNRHIPGFQEIQLFDKRKIAKQNSLRSCGLMISKR